MSLEVREALEWLMLAVFSVPVLAASLVVMLVLTYCLLRRRA